MIQVSRHLRKIAKSDYDLFHVCPSIRLEKSDSHLTDFDKIWNSIFFENLYRKFKYN